MRIQLVKPVRFVCGSKLVGLQPTATRTPRYFAKPRIATPAQLEIRTSRLTRTGCLARARAARATGQA